MSSMYHVCRERRSEARARPRAGKPHTASQRPQTHRTSALDLLYIRFSSSLRSVCYLAARQLDLTRRLLDVRLSLLEGSWT